MVMYGFGNFGYYNDRAMRMAYMYNTANYMLDEISSTISAIRQNNSGGSVYSTANNGYVTNPSSTKVGNILSGLDSSNIYMRSGLSTNTMSEYSPFTALTGQMPPFAENSGYDYLSNERKIRSIPEMMNIFNQLYAGSGVYWRGNPANTPAYGTDLLKMDRTFSSNGFEYSTMEQSYQRWLASQNGTNQVSTNHRSRTNNPNQNTSVSDPKSSHKARNKINSNTGNSTSNTTISGRYNMTNTSVPDNLSEKMIEKINNLTERARSVTEYDLIINKYCNMYGVDPLLVKSIITKESNWNTTAGSSKGAYGLMQLMPATAKQYGCTDRSDPEQNIKAGVELLSKLLERYDYNAQHVLAAYNAGPGHVDDILNGTNKCKKNPNLTKDSSGIPRFKETQEYVPIVLGIYNNLIG